MDLLEIHSGYFAQLLPALPSAWKNGHVKGIVARGAFEVEMFWANGELTKAFITSKAGNPLELRKNQNIIVKDVNSVSITDKISNSSKYITFLPTQAGKTYVITVK
jgi:alpha-L-fucosidase 2